MNVFSLSLKQIKSKPLSSVLNIVLFAFGITIISFLLLVRNGFEEQMRKNVGGIDLVVGAKGSPLQLILSAIYHIDSPTGNISYKEAQTIGEMPLVKQAIPISLGDNYHSFRIVGTTAAYPSLYGGELAEGKQWETSMQATIGSKVARKAGLKIGDTFAGVHGLMEEGGHAHEDHRYEIVGIYKETGTVLDQLILTSLESVWEIHAHGEEEEGHDHTHDHDHDHEHEHAKEVTALLIQYTNPMGVITMPRLVNSSTHMQAASPVMELKRIFSLLGIGIETISLIAWFIILISAFSIFISLLNSMKERQYELALIRVMGGSRFKLFSIVLLEGLIVATIGYLCGFILSRLGVGLLSAYAENSIHYDLAQWVSLNDLYFFLASLVIGFAASVIPAVKALKTDIYKTLNA